MEQTDEPAFNVPPATLYTAASLIIVHILLTVAADDTVRWAYQSLAFSTDRFTAFLNGIGDVGFGTVFLTLCGHLFLHNDFMHLLINAFMLLAFGALVERARGMVVFLLLFFVCGWIGALGEYLVTDPEGGSYLYGASGAVFGMMGASTWLMLPRFGPRKILAFVGVMMGLNLVIGLTPLGLLLTGGEASISWAAHLAGFIAGILLMPLLPARAAPQ